MIELAAILQAVKAGLTGWREIKAAIQGGKLIVQDQGQHVSLAELEPKILALENARDAASQHAADRIDKRHPPDGDL